jgi:hydroxymethylglutaryl-CoA reductase
LRILGSPNSRDLARIGAALGLAQNFAALLALVTTGIQQGHMKLHAARIAFQAGARGQEIQAVAERLAGSGSFHVSTADRELKEWRENHGTRN